MTDKAQLLRTIADVSWEAMAVEDGGEKNPLTAIYNAAKRLQYRTEAAPAPAPADTTPEGTRDYVFAGLKFTMDPTLQHDEIKVVHDDGRVDRFRLIPETPGPSRPVSEPESGRTGDDRGSSPKTDDAAKAAGATFTDFESSAASPVPPPPDAAHVPQPPILKWPPTPPQDAGKGRPLSTTGNATEIDRPAPAVSESGLREDELDALLGDDMATVEKHLAFCIIAIGDLCGGLLTLGLANKIPGPYLRAMTASEEARRALTNTRPPQATATQRDGG